MGSNEGRIGARDRSVVSPSPPSPIRDELTTQTHVPAFFSSYQAPFFGQKAQEHDTSTCAQPPSTNLPPLALTRPPLSPVPGLLILFAERKAKAPRRYSIPEFHNIFLSGMLAPRHATG